MSTVNTAPAFVSQDLLTTVNPKKATAVEGSVEADTNKFMTLLVTQLKNQDPMNPLDNAQLTTQLAQLSTVTGVNKLNTTLESLKASYQSSEALQATNLIGHGVLVAGDFINLASGKAEVSYKAKSRGLARREGKELVLPLQPTFFWRSCIATPPRLTTSVRRPRRSLIWNG